MRGFRQPQWSEESNFDEVEIWPWESPVGFQLENLAMEWVEGPLSGLSSRRKIPIVVALESISNGGQTHHVYRISMIYAGKSNDLWSKLIHIYIYDR